MVDVGLVLNFLQAISIIVGLSIAIIEIRNIGKARKLEALTQLSAWYGQRENMVALLNAQMQEYTSIDEWREKYSWQVNHEAAADTHFLGFVSNMLGKMVKDGLVDPEFVWEILSPRVIIWSWEKYRVIADVRRDRLNDPTADISFEYLYEITKRQHPNISTLPQMRDVSEP